MSLFVSLDPVLSESSRGPCLRNVPIIPDNVPGHLLPTLRSISYTIALPHLSLPSGNSRSSIPAIFEESSGRKCAIPMSSTRRQGRKHTAGDLSSRSCAFSQISHLHGQAGKGGNKGRAWGRFVGELVVFHMVIAMATTPSFGLLTLSRELIARHSCAT